MGARPRENVVKRVAEYADAHAQQWSVLLGRSAGRLEALARDVRGTTLSRVEIAILARHIASDARIGAAVLATHERATHAAAALIEELIARADVVGGRARIVCEQGSETWHRLAALAGRLQGLAPERAPPRPLPLIVTKAAFAWWARA